MCLYTLSLTSPTALCDAAEAAVRGSTLPVAMVLGKQGSLCRVKGIPGSPAALPITGEHNGGGGQPSGVMQRLVREPWVITMAVMLVLAAASLTYSPWGPGSATATPSGSGTPGRAWQSRQLAAQLGADLRLPPALVENGQWQVWRGTQLVQEALLALAQADEGPHGWHSMEASAPASRASVRPSAHGQLGPLLAVPTCEVWEKTHLLLMSLASVCDR